MDEAKKFPMFLCGSMWYWSALESEIHVKYEIQTICQFSYFPILLVLRDISFTNFWVSVVF